MDIAGVGTRVRIYIGESDQWEGRPLFLVLIEALRAEGCAGATVLRGIAGFGAHSRIHTATILRLSEDLPVIVEWVDTPDRVARVLPKIQAMVAEGLITVEPVQIERYRHRVVEDISSRLQVREVMTRDVVRVHPEAPLREAVELLINRDYRALPVVDAQQRVVGIVTNGDLVERGGLRLRVELLGALPTEQLAHELAALEEGKTVADVMTREVVTIGPNTTLADAAHLMVARRLKRLPVVGSTGELLGMISRADILRTRAVAYSPPHGAAPPQVGKTLRGVMRTDIPVVGRHAPLAEVLDAVISTRLNRALVVDDERHVLGVVTDAELIRRLSPEDHPSVLHILMHRLPFVQVRPEQRHALEQAIGTTAENLMDPDIPTVDVETSLGDAIATMLRGRRKILPVVDAEGRLLGAVDRADFLRVLVAIDGRTESA